MDKIIIKGLRVFAHHGVNPEETAMGQNFVLDIEASADLSRACVSDDLASTVSYASIIKTAKRIMAQENNSLLERAAQRVADAVLDEFQSVLGVKVRLMKPEAPIKADFEYTAVEIERGRT